MLYSIVYFSLSQGIYQFCLIIYTHSSNTHDQHSATKLHTYGS
jgi:hypothetical protein